MKVLILVTLSCLMLSAWVDCQLADLSGLVELRKRSLGGIMGGLEGLEGSALSLKKRSYNDDAAINLNLLDALHKKREANPQGWADEFTMKKKRQNENEEKSGSLGIPLARIFL